MNYLKYNLFFLVSFLAYGLMAQKKQNADFSKALNIGNRFEPPTGLSVMRGNMTNLDWEALKDKIIILDFFSTACGTCIEDMPKLQRLQDKYSDKLQIFNVGFQDKATLESFFEKNNFLKENKVNIPVIHTDTVLKRLFPHWAEPHAVIIYNGIVQAITFSRMITAENILKLVQDGHIELPYKNDYNKGNLNAQAGLENSPELIGVWLTGYQNGIRTTTLEIEQDSLTGLYKSSFYNRSIYATLRSVWLKIKMPTYIPRPERVLWKVKDSTQYDNFTEGKDEWNVEHAISYERLDKIKRSDSLQATIILQDLHSLLGIRSYRTMIRRKCLILKPSKLRRYKKEQLEEAITYENSAVLSTFLDMTMDFPPVVDRINRNVKITIGKFENLEELNQQLANNGIIAVVGEADIEVLVIEEVE